MDANAVTSISLPLAATSGGTISATAATVFDAPKLVAGGAVSIKAAGAITLASAAAADLGTLATLKSLTLTAQDEAADFSAGVALTDVSITGKSNASDITIDEAATALANLSFAGKNGDVVIGTNGTDGLEKLVTFSTTGTIASLSVFHAVALTSIDMAHTADAAEGAELIINGNDKLTSLTTSVDNLYVLEITDNTTLASFDASSIRTIPLDADGAADLFSFTVGSNYTAGAVDTLANGKGLKGAYQALDAVNPQEFSQNSLLTLAPYITAIEAARAAGGALAGLPAANAAAAGGGGEFVLSLDYQIADGAAATQALSAVNLINSAAEVANIVAE
jgi:hypothetical protein